jgi:hypothetical protein
LDHATVTKNPASDPTARNDPESQAYKLITLLRGAVLRARE